MPFVAPSIPTMSYSAYSSSSYTSYSHENVQHSDSDFYGTKTRTESHRSETYSQSTSHHSHSTTHHHYSPYPSSRPKYQTETACPYPSPPPSAYSPHPETPRYSYSSSSSSSIYTSSSSSSSSSSRSERSSYGHPAKTRSTSEKFASSSSDPVANSVKHHLGKRLRLGNLSNSPFGFPFHSTYRYENGYVDAASLSYDSYEFEEAVCVPEYPGVGKQHVLFRYVSPQKEENGMMAWKIYLPTAQAGLKEISRQRIGSHDPKIQSSLIAHVQVSPRVMQSSFGADVMSNPSVITNALALSMERGRVVTVEITFKASYSRTSSRRPRGHYNSGEVLYVLTDRDGTERAYA